MLNIHHAYMIVNVIASIQTVKQISAKMPALLIQIKPKIEEQNQAQMEQILIMLNTTHKTTSRAQINTVMRKHDMLIEREIMKEEPTIVVKNTNQNQLTLLQPKPQPQPQLQLLQLHLDMPSHNCHQPTLMEMMMKPSFKT